MSKLSKLVKSFMAWSDFISRRRIYSVDVFDKSSGRYVFSFFSTYRDVVDSHFCDFKAKYVLDFPDHELESIFLTYVNLDFYKNRVF